MLWQNLVMYVALVIVWAMAIDSWRRYRRLRRELKEIHRQMSEDHEKEVAGRA